MILKYTLLLSASFGALMLMPTLAVAQDVEGDDVVAASEGETVKRLGTVTVSAERRDQDLLDVPVAVTAFGDAERDLLGVLSANDIADYTPGMTYQNEPNRITIRGIGRLDNAQGTDPGVATYVDGAYTSETAFLGASPIFIERTEVLRGPQGTLFGRNAIGGSINIITKRPEFESSQEVRLRAGSFDRIDGWFTTTGPVFGSDKTAYRINLAGYGSGEGAQHNTLLGNGPNAGKIASASSFWSGEIQLKHNFTENISVWGKYFTSNTDTSPSYNRSNAPFARDQYVDFYGNPGVAPYQIGVAPNPLFGLNYENPSLGSGNIHERSLDFSGKIKTDDVHLFTWALDWETELADFQYIGSHQNYDYDSLTDYDGTSRATHTLGRDVTGAIVDTGVPTSTFYVNYIGDSKRWESHEITLTSNDESQLQWIGGLYYYKERANQPFALRAPMAPAAGTPVSVTVNSTFDALGINTGACFGGFAPDFFCGIYPQGEANPNNDFYYQNGRLYSKAYAAFGQLDYAFGDRDQFNVKAGLRYTKDEKRGEEVQNNYVYSPGADPYTGFVDALVWYQLTPNNNTQTLEDEWNAVTGTLGFNWEYNDDSLAYAQYTRGYKSGGFRLGTLIRADDPATPYNDQISDRELVDAYEVGLKSELFDNSLRLATSLFYYDYQDLQVPVTVVNPVTQISQSRFVNVPESEAIGLEIEALWQPTDNFRLGANYAYLDTEISEMFDVVDSAQPGTVLVSPIGNTLPRSPKNSGTAYASYTLDFEGFGDLTLAGDVVYTDDQHTTLLDNPQRTVYANERANLRAIWNNEGGDWTIIGSINNVFDDDTPNTTEVGSLSQGFQRLETLNNQRTFFVELQKRF